jgi:hypothetical protein
MLSPTKKIEAALMGNNINSVLFLPRESAKEPKRKEPTLPESCVASKI